MRASDQLWGARGARALAPDGGTFRPARGLAADMGYGLSLLGDRFTGTPNIGFGMSDTGARDYRIGWRMTSAVEGDPGFEVRLDATRREAANDNGPPGDAEHGVMLRSLIRWWGRRASVADAVLAGVGGSLGTWQTVS